MPYARANGITTYYEEEGSGIPVLFIHGGFGGAESTMYPKPSVFKGVLPPDRFRSVFYERRSGGRSQYVEGHYSLDDLADDAKGLLEDLGIGSAMIVGDSLGGIVAQRLAARHPAIVESLLLCETGARIIEVQAKISATLLATRVVPMRMAFPFIKAKVLQPQFYDPLGPLTEDEIEGRRRHHAEYTQRLRALPYPELYTYSMGLLRNYAAFVNTDLRAAAATLAMPIDIMHATGDRVVPFERGLELHGAMPQARFHRLEGLGHGLFYYPEARTTARGIIEDRAETLFGGRVLAAGD